MKTLDAPVTINSPRVRFNWGFHDATLDREMGWRDRRRIEAGKTFCLPQGRDKLSVAYRAGYEYGMRCDMSNGRPETSNEAWTEYGSISL